jgi:hypothetical protein
VPGEGAPGQQGDDGGGQQGEVPDHQRQPEGLQGGRGAAAADGELHPALALLTRRLHLLSLPPGPGDSLHSLGAAGPRVPLLKKVA